MFLTDARHQSPNLIRAKINGQQGPEVIFKPGSPQLLVRVLAHTVSHHSWSSWDDKDIFIILLVLYRVHVA